MTTAVSFMRVLRNREGDNIYERKIQKNQFSSVLFFAITSVDARAYVSATSFASKKKNVSLIRALELVSLSLCVSLLCGFVRFFFRRKQNGACFRVTNSYTLNIFCSLSRHKINKNQIKKHQTRAALLASSFASSSASIAKPINHESKI
jgi:hypothetical protein